MVDAELVDRRTSLLDRHGGLGALPVLVSAGGREADAIRSWVEGVLGWQAVHATDDQLVPAAVELCDLDADTATAVDVPRVLLVDDTALSTAVARGAARLRPDAVVGWPSGRDQLADTVAEVMIRRRAPVASTRAIRVGGSAGGVGTSTVALALAGLAAWRGARTFVAVRGTGLPLRSLPAAALSTPDLWSRSDPVAGVSSLRGVVLSDDGEVPELTDGSVDACLVDAGVDPDVDVLVCRPDGAARAMLAATTAAAVVVVGNGPATPRDLRRVAAGRTLVWLPWSVRVARAGYHDRVPAGLPGAWLGRLEPLAPRSGRVHGGVHRRRSRRSLRDVGS